MGMYAPVAASTQRALVGLIVSGQLDDPALDAVIAGAKGGPGSGFRGHAGRPGLRGGSQAQGGVESWPLGPFEDRAMMQHVRDYYFETGPIDPLSLHSQVAQWRYKIEQGKAEPRTLWYKTDENDPQSYVSRPVSDAEYNHIFQQYEAMDNARQAKLRTRMGLPDDLRSFLTENNIPYDTALNKDPYRLMKDDPEGYGEIERSFYKLAHERILKLGSGNVSQSDLQGLLVTHFDDETDALHLSKEQRSNLDAWKYEVLQSYENWNAYEVRHGIALGKIDPETGKKTGVYQADTPQGEGRWEPMPETLWHATTNAEAILKDQIRSRIETGQGNMGIGLSGGENDTISFTGDKKVADNIVRALHEAHLVAKGDITIRRMVELAAEGGGAKRQFLSELAGQYGGSRDQTYTMDTLPYGLKSLIHAEENHEAAAREAPDYVARKRWEVYGDFSRQRQNAGGPEDPLFFGTNYKGLAKANPANFAVLEYTPKKKSRGYQMSALGEWRTVGGDTVRLKAVHRPVTVGDVDKIVGLKQRWVVV